jgi:hypothetical protein
LGEQPFTQKVLKKMIKERIEKTDIGAVKNDVRPFLKTPQEMEIWNTAYFLQLADMIRYCHETN